MLGIRIAGAILSACLATVAQADTDIYQCPTPGGGTTYLDQPCPGGLRFDGSKWVAVPPASAPPSRPAKTESAKSTSHVAPATSTSREASSESMSGVLWTVFVALALGLLWKAYDGYASTRIPKDLSPEQRAAELDRRQRVREYVGAGKKSILGALLLALLLGPIGLLYASVAGGLALLLLALVLIFGMATPPETAGAVVWGLSVISAPLVATSHNDRLRRQAKAIVR